MSEINESSETSSTVYTGLDQQPQLISEVESYKHLRVYAIREIMDALGKIPKYSDGEVKTIDREAKQKRPLDKARANLQLITDILEQSPVTKQYFSANENATGESSSIYISKHRESFRSAVQKRGLPNRYYFLIKPMPPGLYIKDNNAIREITIYALEEMSETGQYPAFRHRLSQINSLGNLSVEQIGNSILKSLDYNPKRDDQELKEITDKEKQVKIGEESIQILEDN